MINRIKTLAALCALLLIFPALQAAPIVAVSATAPVEAFAPITAATLPPSSSIGQPLVVSFTGTTPVNIHWFRWTGSGVSEIAEARNQISYTPTGSGWIYAILWNEQPTGGAPSWGIRVVNGASTGWVPFTSSQATGWTFVQ